MASPKDYNKVLQTRVARQRAFHQSKEPGDLLVFARRERGYALEAFLSDRLKHGLTEQMFQPSYVNSMIAEYVRLLRESFTQVLRFDDDNVPTALVYCGIGVITAAQTHIEPVLDGYTSWLEPQLSWEQIDQLRFDPNNRWLQFALLVNQALWHLWDGDFHVLPFLHRSPLDAANGIRGTDLFMEMYTEPQRVHALLDKCVQWQLAVEKFLDENIHRPCPPGWGNAVWGTWLPDRSVFVNGDPVGLVGREMALEFEQPYTARLFTGTGGGFFHNHTVGLHQADLVSSTPGTLVQFFVNDPKQPSAPTALLDMPNMRDKLLAASLDAPIGVVGVPIERTDEFLDIVCHGRFIIVPADDGNKSDAQLAEFVRKVRSLSNIG